MRFINPKTDFAFKKIFGSKESKPILMSFLNAILYDGESTIVDLTIVDPYSVPRMEGMKDTYLDVRAQLVGGETVLIEMQVLNVEGFEKRVLYNAAKEYANQLQKSADYSSLRPVIALTITDFKMFREKPLEDRIINRFALIEKEQFIDYPDGDVELVFVELPKFNLELDELRTLAEKWMYFLKEAQQHDLVPESLAAIPEIDDAFKIAEYSRLTRDEERALDKKLQWLADQKSIQKTYQTVQEAYESLEEKTQSLEEKNESLEEKTQSLEEKNESLEEKTQSLEEKNESLEEKTQSLEKEKESLESEKESLESNLKKQASGLERARQLLRNAGMSEAEIDKELESE